MRFDTPDGSLDVEIKEAIVAGWTGRDRAEVDHHIAELAAIGVAPPSAVPLFYRVSASLLTQSDHIEVVGPDTSGEIEPLIIKADGKLWLGLGSDQTDRALETVSVAASKQICAKPVASALWSFDEVSDHLDQLELHCEIEEGGAFTDYQKGTLANIRPLPDLIAASGLTDGGAMLCGTLGAIGGVRPAAMYRMALVDPVLTRRISFGYGVTALPVVA